MIFQYFFVTITLMTILITSVFGHDGPSDPKRLVHIQHHAYILGVQNGINAAGGYRTVSDRNMMEDFFKRWSSAFTGFSEEANTYLLANEFLPTDWILDTYRRQLEKSQIQCGHPIWIDTGTNKYCQ